MSTGGWIAVAVAVALVLFVVAVYNRLVVLRNRFKNEFSQIDVRQTLESVTKARGDAVSAAQRAAAAPGDAAAMQGLAQAEGALGGALGRLLAVVESYPDLKANQNVLGLQEELTSTENRIAFARQAYNDSVMEYNTRRESFPDNLLAGAFGFSAAELLQATESAGERRAPKVSFS